jgi:ribosomal protein S18 acetylase RimI-like enzyme
MTKIITVNEKNLANHPQVICFINPKNEFYSLKFDWLKKRFKEGLVVKLVYVPEKKSPVGFIEYVPGKYSWRAVDAKGFIFIHCIWVTPKKVRHQGLGKLLIGEAVKDARAKGLSGVAVVTSDKAFMATRELFLKNGFKLVEEIDDLQLLAKTFSGEKGKPSFVDNRDQLKKYRGWHILYTKQCPWVARFVEEVKSVVKKEKLKVVFKELSTPAQAQASPSFYTSLTVIKDGRVLADRYISVTRFLNIVKKERGK